MSLARHSPQRDRNAHIEDLGPESPDNRALLEAALMGPDASAGDVLVVLAGRADPFHVRLRFAQSELRHDLSPSHFSEAALLLAKEGGGFQATLVPFELGDAATVPMRNGVTRAPLDRWKSTIEYPNLAVLRFSSAERDELHRAVAAVESLRMTVDLVTPLSKWLAYGWGATPTNPLHEGVPMPSAALVEHVFACGGLDVAPGLTARATCPEAIWQAASWWSDAYASDDHSLGAEVGRPSGAAIVRHRLTSA